VQSAQALLLSKAANSPKNSANDHGWANHFSKRNAADSVIWAQCYSRDMLPNAVNGPIGAAKKFYRWPRMGQPFLKKKCCQRCHMGPMLLQRHAAESCEWAHWCCQKILPMATDGPAVSQKEMLPMVSYGPNVTPETCCRTL
jgi:hypothetical protein